MAAIGEVKMEVGRERQPHQGVEEYIFEVLRPCRCERMYEKTADTI